MLIPVFSTTEKPPQEIVDTTAAETEQKALTWTGQLPALTWLGDGSILYHNKQYDTVLKTLNSPRLPYCHYVIISLCSPNSRTFTDS